MTEQSLLFQLLASAVTILVGFALTLGGIRLLDRFGVLHQILPGRTLYLKKMVKYGMLALVAVTVGLIWGVDLASLWIVVSSLFGIIGIALFAQWSLLSNVTSSFVLYFSASFKIDDTVTIKDGDNSVSGRVVDMTLFYIRIRNAEGDTVSVPNNLMLQKAVVRHGNVGAAPEQENNTPA
jgi:small-conductance mechanosensitive channel